jgi:hypothetical protein
MTELLLPPQALATGFSASATLPPKILATGSVRRGPISWWRREYVKLSDN